MKKIRFTKKTRLVILFVLFSICFQSQNLQIYTQKKRYNESEMQKNSYLKYDFLGNYYIDRHHKGIVNYQQVEQGLNALYPNELSCGFLSIDLENIIYHNLKSQDLLKRKKSVNQFVKLIKFIKKKRPNVKVGIYGLPYSFNYNFQKKYNHINDLKKILVHTDYISPSLYFSFSEKQQNDISYQRYVRKNLKLFLQLSYELDKPLYVYVWYLIHPYNKKYGRQMISTKRMGLLLKNIKNINYKGNKTKGVIWWESSDTSYNRSNEKSKKMSITEILLEYTKPIIK